MSQGVRPEDYVWVVVEKQGGQENFLGVGLPHGGQFIPATKTKEEGLMLLGKLPQAAGLVREVESIHKFRLVEEAKLQGFAVFVVDSQGQIIERLGQAN